MGDKSPKKNNAKKPAKTIKEKRAAKNEKRHPTSGFGAGKRVNSISRRTSAWSTNRAAAAFCVVNDRSGLRPSKNAVTRTSTSTCDIVTNCLPTATATRSMISARETTAQRHRQASFMDGSSV